MSEHLIAFEEIICQAVSLAQSDLEDTAAIRQLGEGWVAEETLAIAVYCAVKYANDFEKAVVAAVNHNGDSDPTGAVTGNIVGALVGYENIPDKFKETLELRAVIEEVAADLNSDCPEDIEYEDSEEINIWLRKYVEHTYPER